MVLKVANLPGELSNSQDVDECQALVVPDLKESFLLLDLKDFSPEAGSAPTAAGNRRTWPRAQWHVTYIVVGMDSDKLILINFKVLNVQLFLTFPTSLL